jgi:hypothetical protein
VIFFFVSLLIPTALATNRVDPSVIASIKPAEFVSATKERKKY